MLVCNVNTSTANVNMYCMFMVEWASRFQPGEREREILVGGRDVMCLKEKAEGC